MIFIFSITFVFLAVAPMPTGFSGVAQIVTDIVAIAIILLGGGRVHIASRSAFWAAIGFAAIGVLWLLLGLANGSQDLGRVWGDTRPFLRIATAIVIVAWWWHRYGVEECLRRYIKLAFWISIYSLGVLALSLAGSTAFSVRTENAVLYAGDASLSSDSLRVSLSSGIFLIVAGVVSLRLLSSGLRKELHSRAFVILFVASVVALTAYSRSYFVLLSVALLGMLVLGPLRKRLLLGIAMLASVFGFTLFLIYAISTILDLDYWKQLTSAGAAYAGRVLNGLLFDTLAVDASTLWRVRESDAAVSYFQSNPVFGSGFGVQYRSYLFREIFAGSYGLTYIHSAYLWILVKTGMVGAATISVLFLRSILGALSARFRGTAPFVSSAMLSITAGLLAIMIGSPIMFDSAGAVVVGSALGLGLLLRRWRDPQDGSPESEGAVKEAENSRSTLNLNKRPLTKLARSRRQGGRRSLSGSTDR